MRRIVDAVADQAEGYDGLRPGLYAADLLQRVLASTDADHAGDGLNADAGLWRQAGAHAPATAN